MNAGFAKHLRVPVLPKSHLLLSARTLFGANSTPLSVIGATTANVSIGGYVCSVEFVVGHSIVIESLHHDVIFGLNMLRDNIMLLMLLCQLSLTDNLLTVPLIQRF